MSYSELVYEGGGVAHAKPSTSNAARRSKLLPVHGLVCGRPGVIRSASTSSREFLTGTPAQGTNPDSPSSPPDVVTIAAPGCTVSEGAGITLEDPDGTHALFIDGQLEIEITSTGDQITIVGPNDDYIGNHAYSSSDPSFDTAGDYTVVTTTEIACGGASPSQGTPEASASPIASSPPSSPPATTTASPPASGSPIDSGPGEEATTPEATTQAADQRPQGDEGCTNPQPVTTFSGTENQVTAPFDITGESFRLRYETAPNGPDPFLPSVDIEVLNQSGQPIGEGPLIFEGEDGSENILAGPGTFGLEITAEEASYDITVEDCIGTSTEERPGPPEPRPGPVDRREGVIRETPVRRIPNTAGPPYLAVGALALLGAALVAGRGVFRR
jgi:hypothetical protein